MRGYAICTEPRSGSTVLTRILTSTGVLGRPTEYFNPETMRNWRGAPDYPSEPEAQLGEILRLGATPNGVYGLKVFSAEFDAVKATRWPERLPDLSFIHLERHDLLGQAISHVRALQTWQWVSFRPAQAEPVYDPAAINRELVGLVRANTRWRYFLASNGLPVLNLVYEEVMRFPQETVEAVARLVGVSETPRIDWDQAKDLEIQRDDLTEAWRARFIAETRNLGAFH